MKTLSTLLLTMLAAFTLACGYSSKNYAPTAGTMPAISALSPSSTAAGGPAFTLTVNGNNFNASAVVNWNGTPQTTKYLGVGQLTMSVPASLIAAAGSAKITVTNPATSGTGLYGNSGGTLAETSPAVTFTIK